MRSVLRLSGSGTFQILIGTASYVGLVRILSVFGSDALAGYTIGIRVILFALLPAFGISNAAATMVGQNLGAGRPDRAERAVWTAAFYSMIFLGAVGLLFFFGARPIAGLFTDDPAVLPFAVSCLRIVSLGFLFYGVGMVLTQSFNGAGDTWTPTLINLGVFWLWEIPLAWWLAVHAGLGPRGVFIALMVAYSTLAVVSAVQAAGLTGFFSGVAMSFVPETASVTAPAAAARDGVWATLRDAIRGSSIDYTTAPIGRAVIMLAVPMVMEMAMESIFAVADVFWVAHLGAKRSRPSGSPSRC